MKRVGIYELVEGMILDEDVIDRNGILIMSRGHVLDPKYIEILENLDYIEVAIHEASDDVEVKESPDKFEKQYQNAVTQVKEIFHGYKIGGRLVKKEIEDCMEPLLEEITNNNQIAKKVWQLKVSDLYTFEHSVSVSILTALIGKWLKLNDDHVRNLAMAGMLHDIGKCNIPDSILDKRQPLNEVERNVIKTHPTLGYILLLDVDDFSKSILDGVLDHHENMDGTGYPNRLRGTGISMSGRIVAIANRYANLVSAKNVEHRVSPFDAANLMLRDSFSKYDTELVRLFLNKMAQYYVGCIVELNDGTEAEIIMVNKEDPIRPLVKAEDRFIDLAKESEYYIEKLLS